MTAVVSLSRQSHGRRIIAIFLEIFAELESQISERVASEEIDGTYESVLFFHAVNFEWLHEEKGDYCAKDGKAYQESSVRLRFILPWLLHLPLPIQKGPVFPLGESGPPNASDSRNEGREICIDECFRTYRR